MEIEFFLSEEGVYEGDWRWLGAFENPLRLFIQQKIIFKICPEITDEYHELSQF